IFILSRASIGMRLLLLIVTVATAVSSLRPMFGGRRNGRMTSHLQQHRSIDALTLAADAVGSEWIAQKLDHFDSANTKTWQQRYFYNNQYAKDGSNVNVLYVDGEEIDDANYITGTDKSYMYYAQQMGAYLYTLEHRFYGKSYPTENASTENLKYLSSRLAVEDLAEFIRQKNAEKGGNQKWILVGGSYGGSLAAWARLKHPELVDGALASSAPILAKMDFYGYLQKIDEVLNNIGGLCYDRVSEGFEKARQFMQSPGGRDQLSTMFNITTPFSAFDDITDTDRDTFFGFLTAEFEMSVQSNIPPVTQLCQDIAAHPAGYDPLQALADVATPYIPFSVNFTQTIEEMSQDDFANDVSWRLWIYQTCTEFGFFQTTNTGKNLFGQTQSSNQFIEWCSQVFGISGDQVRKNVDATNEYYGGRDYFYGTNTIFSHGTQDPWMSLTKNDDPKHWSVVIVEVEGGYHMSDIGKSCFAPNAACTDNMKQIQQLTFENMKRWVDPVFPVPNRVDITDNVGKRPQFIDTNVISPLPANFNPPFDEIRAKRSVGKAKTSKRNDSKKWNKFTGNRRKVLPPSPMSQLAEATDLIGQDFIVQTWDHFNTNEERTFRQKWYYNYKFGSTDGPNFLMIGEEGPEDISWVQHENLDWIKNAKEVGANVFLLEHRYYGESKLGTNDLQYLTSAQMLYDVAAFIRTQQVKQKLTGPWITFGGSYSGALTAWSREWFPELILGGVGSSGPVQAKNDFYEYLEVVEDVIKRHSQKCYDRTTEAFTRLHKLSLDPAGRLTIQQKFKLSPAWTGADDEIIDALDMNEVFMNLYGLYQGTVQYNSVDWSDVTALCKPMEDDKYDDPLDALRAIQVATYDGDDNVQTLSSFATDLKSSLIDYLTFVDGHDPRVDDEDLAGVLWTWQTCNEFGYFQTTDYGEGIFGTPVPLNFFITMCENVFGVGMTHVEKGIARTIYQYGGRARYNATNLVLPNGDADPWHALGIIEQGNLDGSIVPILIKGTSHCADMYASTPDDPPELTAARQTITANIKKWLAPPIITTTQSGVTNSFIVAVVTILLSIMQ
ncbi:hypothetical protein PFISCL1PPCAC_14791, partial [Pristionchus fissidentatus]